MRDGHRHRWGAVLVILGTLLLLEQLGAFDLGDLFSVLLPLGFIVWGVSLLRRPRAEDIPPVSGERTSSADLLDASTVFGDFEARITSTCFRGGSVSTVFGDTRIDLGGAQLAEGEQLLKVDGVFGDATVIAPRGWAIAFHGRTVLGDLEIPGQRREGMGSRLDDATPGYDQAARRLRVQASQVFGDVRLREA